MPYGGYKDSGNIFLACGRKNILFQPGIYAPRPAMGQLSHIKRACQQGRPRPKHHVNVLHQHEPRIYKFVKSCGVCSSDQFEFVVQR